MAVRLTNKQRKLFEANISFDDERTDDDVFLDEVVNFFTWFRDELADSLKFAKDTLVKLLSLSVAEFITLAIEIAEEQA